MWGFPPPFSFETGAGKPETDAIDCMQGPAFLFAQAGGACLPLRILEETLARGFIRKAVDR